MLIRFSVKIFCHLHQEKITCLKNFLWLQDVFGEKGTPVWWWKDQTAEICGSLWCECCRKIQSGKGNGFYETGSGQWSAGWTYRKILQSKSENAMKPSYFEVEILLDGKYYSYGFEIILSKSRFISEWLVELHADNSEKILLQETLQTERMNCVVCLHVKG